MHINDFVPADGLAAALDAGHVTRKEHPSLPLAIYTYTRICQYDNIWTPVTMRCRGLIADTASQQIAAMPFPKIFVTGMHGAGHPFAPPLPAEPFEIYEKVDGSLAIVFHYDGRWHAASKGSFISEQAQWAQHRLDTRDTSALDPKLTYLAEAIYPSNRIVVDYGDREDLVLLAAYRPADGTELPLADAAEHWAPIGPAARAWGLHSDITELEKAAAGDTTMSGRTVGGTAEEGYVIRFASGLRAKVKLSAYLALHKLYTGTNERTVWEVLASGQDPAVLFDQVPDEFAAWVRGIADQLRQLASDYIEAAAADFAAIGRLPQRKEFALKAVDSPYRAALFRLYDGRDITDLAWKHVRPRAESTFKTDEEG